MPLLRSLAIVMALSNFVRPHQASPTVTAVPYQASGIYKVGDKVGWNFTHEPSGTPFVCRYSLRENNGLERAAGELDLTSGKAFLENIVDRPQMLYLDLTLPGGQHLAFGAAVDPQKLRPVQKRPPDFDRFWRAKVAELRRIPANPVLFPGDSTKPNVDYATIRMDSTNGTHVYGQIAKPSKPGPYPAMLILQWASPPYPLWPGWVTDRAAEGWLVLNIEPHDVLPTAPQSYYNSLPNELKNYMSVGQDDRDQSAFVQMYLRGIRALDYLADRPDWDRRTLVVTGGSMGGQQSLALAGLDARVTHVIVEEPAGCDLEHAALGRPQGYPWFPPNDPKAAETSRYIDCVNFAPDIKAKCLVAMGFKDTIAPPAGIWTAFNLIKGPKEAAPMPDAPHNNIATAEQQLPYTTRAAAWMNALVHGQPVPPKP